MHFACRNGKGFKAHIEFPIPKILLVSDALEVVAFVLPTYLFQGTNDSFAFPNNSISYLTRALSDAAAPYSAIAR